MTGILQIFFQIRTVKELYNLPASRIVFCLLISTISAFTCIAGENPGLEQTRLDQLLSAVQQKVNSTKTVQCIFEQERNLSIFDQPILFTGKMELSRPDKLRWENLEPIPSVLIFAGDKGLRCNDDAPPIHFELGKDPIMKMISEQIWTWVDGNYGSLKNKYTITLTAENQITLVPQSGEFAGVITSVKVTFDQDSLQPTTINIMENEGDSTIIRFADYRLNQPVNDILFTTCYP